MKTLKKIIEDRIMILNEKIKKAENNLVSSKDGIILLKRRNELVWILYDYKQQKRKR